MLLEQQTDQARDLVAALLTRCRGEYVFRIGSRPQHDRLFVGEAVTAQDGKLGTTRSLDDLETLCVRLAAAVDELGGKVRVVGEIRPASKLIGLRLPRYINSRHLRIEPLFYYDYLHPVCH